MRNKYEKVAKIFVMADRINRFLIGSWVTYFDYSIMSQEEQMKRLVSLGINYQPFPYSWYQDETRDDLEDWKEIDRLCQKYGVLYGLKLATKTKDEQEIFEKTISMGKQMSDNLVVYHLKDEPNWDEVEPLGKWIRRYRKADENVMPTFNLHPSYASVRRLGNSYRGYLQAMVDAAGKENVVYLSHDFYPFDKNHTRRSMFADMEDVRSVAWENGKLKTHGFLQSCEWDKMRMPNIDEIRWHAYAHLAYGFKAISYFNIVLPRQENPEHFTDGLINQDGKVLNEELLAAIGELNKELHAVGNQTFSMNAAHAYHTHEVTKEIELLPAEYAVTPVDKEKKFVVTEFDNEEYFMLFNNNFEEAFETEFIVKGMKSVEVFNAKTNKYEPCAFDGEILKVSFEKGEALLFKKK